MKIGLIGCGHLGLAFAKQLLKKGYDKSLLKLSYGGLLSTLERIKKAGLETCIASNTAVCADSDVIILTIKPDNVSILSSFKFTDKSKIISCIAGYDTARLFQITGQNITRIMTSSPMTIEAGKGVCAVYKGDSIVENLLSDLELTIYRLSSEDLFHQFTSAVCLPGAFLQLELDKRAYSDYQFVAEYYNEFEIIGQLIAWAHMVTPQNLSAVDKELYISKMATKGGITEAMIDALKNRATLSDAFKCAVHRSIEISLK